MQLTEVVICPGVRERMAPGSVRVHAFRVERPVGRGDGVSIVVVVDEPYRITGVDRDVWRHIRIAVEMHGDDGTRRGSVRKDGREREKREADQKVFHIRYMPPER